MTDLCLEADPPSLGFSRFSWWSPVAPTVAIVLAIAAGVMGWRGVDLPAQLYRVGLFHRQGLTLWDSQWYGGHWTLDYSVIFPPIAGVLGVQLTEALSAALAALAFDRLVVGHFGRAARFGSFAFAIGTLVQVAIGQLPFLLGESLALCALWAASGRRWVVAALLAVGASLASPLAAAFLMLAAAAWLLTTWPRNRVKFLCLMVAAATPVGVLALMFPGQGMMPFPAIDFLVEASIFVAVLLVVPRRERALRIGLCMYVVALAFAFLLPTPLGGNVERLGECMGAPLAFCLLWPLRHRLLAILAVPLAMMQWGPAVGAFAANSSDPSTHKAYFTPMVDFVVQHDNPRGRLEVVPTHLHWEVAYAAPSVPLARGWERQLDTAHNGLFYTGGTLNASTYRAWLLSNGVRFVALADVPLDYAGVGEARLVAKGVPGLKLVWTTANWKVFEVDGSTGIVSGPARAVRIDGGVVLLDVTKPGIIHVRERYSPRWSVVEGSGCTSEDPGGWLAVDASSAGPLRLELRLVPPAGDPC